jgi:hypothetical protein
VPGGRKVGKTFKQNLKIMTEEMLGDSEFWWLPKGTACENLLVGLGHQRPLTGEEDPKSVMWCRPLDAKEEPCNNLDIYSLDFLDRWRNACNNINVYRTLKIFNKDSGEAAFLGPFIVDIDNEKENLEDALGVARQAVDFIIKHYNLGKDDLRIFFTGHKGFNIEVRPEALRIDGSITYQIELSAQKLDKIIEALRDINKIEVACANIVTNQDTCIDAVYGNRVGGYWLKYPYTRLHCSINKWVRNHDSEMARMKTQISLDELRNRNVADISLDAERLASDALDLLKDTHP